MSLNTNFEGDTRHLYSVQYIRFNTALQEGRGFAAVAAGGQRCGLGQAAMAFLEQHPRGERATVCSRAVRLVGVGGHGGTVPGSSALPESSLDGSSTPSFGVPRSAIDGALHFDDGAQHPCSSVAPIVAIRQPTLGILALALKNEFHEPDIHRDSYRTPPGRRWAAAPPPRGRRKLGAAHRFLEYPIIPLEIFT